jgi:hypothetical protein
MAKEPISCIKMAISRSNKEIMLLKRSSLAILLIRILISILAYPLPWVELVVVDKLHMVCHLFRQWTKQEGGRLKELLQCPYLLKEVTLVLIQPRATQVKLEQGYYQPWLRRKLADKKCFKQTVFTRELLTILKMQLIQ